MHYEPVTGPGVWRGRELATRTDWIRPFSASEIQEIEGAVRAFVVSGRPLESISPATFPLPGVGATLKAILAELLEGRGFVLLRGLPVESWSREEQAAAYLGLGSWLGTARSQNAK